jgi:hypothetical protein
VLAVHKQDLLTSRCEWVGYLSSTAVYGDHQGQLVTEECGTMFFLYFRDNMQARNSFVFRMTGPAMRSVKYLDQALLLVLWFLALMEILCRSTSLAMSENLKTIIDVEKEWLQLHQDAAHRLPVHIFRLGGGLPLLLLRLFCATISTISHEQRNPETVCT